MFKMSSALLAIALSYASTASAAYYSGYCDESACTPFLVTNSYVPSKAVSLAQLDGAAVGDTIELDHTRNGPNCSFFWIIWTVNHTPVVNSTDLTTDGTVHCEQ
jgi:hypothetical protein